MPRVNDLFDVSPQNCCGPSCGCRRAALRWARVRRHRAVDNPEGDVLNLVQRRIALTLAYVCADQIVAKRLLESKQTIPHFYLSIDCQMDALMG